MQNETLADLWPELWRRTRIFGILDRGEIPGSGLIAFVCKCRIVS